MRSGKEADIPEFGNKLEGINYIDRPGAYAAIENKDKQIAVIQTGNGYFLPGGRMDPGETEVDALKRELVEEIGYQLSEIVEIGAAVEYINASTEIGITGYEACFIKRSSMPKWRTESKRIIS